MSNVKTLCRTRAWLGVWILVVLTVACGAARLRIPSPEAGVPQPTAGWTVLPTRTATPTPWWRMTPSAAATAGQQAAASVSETPLRTRTAQVVPSPTPTPVILGRVSIPRVGIDTDIVAVSWHLEWLQGQQVAVWDVAQNDAGWHRGTAHWVR
jgi:hypothetical protein